MGNECKILALNFGSTSTKIGAFKGEEPIFIKSFDHGEEGYPAKFKDLVEHEEFAVGLIAGILAENSLKPEDFDVFVGRGGAQVSIASGAYLINEIMYEDTFKFGGERHPGKLGTRICYAFSKKYGKSGYIVNAPSVDEFDAAARFTGLSDMWRASRIHTLNQKEVAYRYAKQAGKPYNELNLIVCHIGGGISVTAHKKGRMADSNDIIEGEGPMSPTRAGALPILPVIEMAYSGKYQKEELILRMVKTGGLTDHLGSSDLREIEKRIADGDEYARLVVDAMLYQIAKCAGSMAVVLDGQVDAILLTGGMARSQRVVDTLSQKLAWIAPASVYPGEFEMQALAAGIMRVIDGEETANEYTGTDVWTGFKK